VHDALEQPDLTALKELASSERADELPASTLVLIGDVLREFGGAEQAAELLRRAQGRHPGDFWVNESLAEAFRSRKPPKLEEAIRFFSVAVALRPQSPVAWTNLAHALDDAGRLDEAEVACKEAVRLKPDSASDHKNLGKVLDDQGKAAEAKAEFREPLRLQPDFPQAHSSLGNLLKGQGRAPEAEKEYREALRLQPDFPTAHNNLGALLERFSLRCSGRRAPLGSRRLLSRSGEPSRTRYTEGKSALADQSKHEEAEAEYRKALGLKPDHPEAHCGLGLALRDQGRFREALDELRRGHELGSRDPTWRYPSAAWVEKCRRLVEREALLPAVLSGEAEPADAAAQLGLAELCQQPYKRRYAASARLYADAFSAQPRLAEGVPFARYNAACAAALAGCGKGADAPDAEAERARLRDQALKWLRGRPERTESAGGQLVPRRARRGSRGAARLAGRPGPRRSARCGRARHAARGGTAGVARPLGRRRAGAREGQGRSRTGRQDAADAPAAWLTVPRWAGDRRPPCSPCNWQRRPVTLTDRISPGRPACAPGPAGGRHHAGA
jgi:tetratricopeptide (TPR) repeat protein